MDFSLSEEQIQLQKRARHFAQNEIRPAAAHYDEADVFPWDILRKAADARLYGPAVYADHEKDPSGLPLILMGEELAWACGGIALAILSTGLPFYALQVAGTDEQIATWVPRLFGTAQEPSVSALAVTEPEAGSDVSSIATTAVRDGDDWVLNGDKSFITNGGIAKVHIVAATVQPGAGHGALALFIVPAGTPGFGYGARDRKLGVRASHTCALKLRDVRVPADCLLGGIEGLEARLGRLSGRKGGQPQAGSAHDAEGASGSGSRFNSAGGSDILRALEITRPHVAAQAVGVARAALEFSAQYAQKRRQFGRPIIEHQAVGRLLSRMAVEVDCARLLTYKAGWASAAFGRFESAEGSKAKLKASEAAVRVTEDAIQICGGYGYVKDNPVEKWYRDSKIYTLFEGTSQIQEILIARALRAGKP